MWIFDISDYLFNRNLFIFKYNFRVKEKKSNYKIKINAPAKRRMNKLGRDKNYLTLGCFRSYFNGGKYNFFSLENILRNCKGQVTWFKLDQYIIVANSVNLISNMMKYIYIFHGHHRCTIQIQTSMLILLAFKFVSCYSKSQYLNVRVIGMFLRGFPSEFPKNMT